MSVAVTERPRMILDIPTEVQMAIRLRAVKRDTTTGAIVCEAVQLTFASDIEEAKAAIAEQHRIEPKSKKK